MLKNLKMNLTKNISISRTAVITELRRVYFEYSENTHLTIVKFKLHSKIGYNIVIKHFGSWRNALIQAELNSEKRPTRFYEKAIIAELRRVYFEYYKNSPLTVTNFKLHSKISYDTVNRHFGSWRKALKKAEIKYTSKIFTTQEKRKLILTDLHRIKEYNQGIYFNYEFYKEESGRYDRAVIFVIFKCKNWKELLDKELEIYQKTITPKTKSSYQKSIKSKTESIYTENQLFDELKRVWEKLGRRPNYLEFQKDSTILIKNYTEKYKSWPLCIIKFCSKNKGFKAY
jgi:hypothetical protein